MGKSQQPQRFGDLDPSEWPGERLGLPENGHLSVARIGRRFGAIFIDWAIASFASLIFPVPPAFSSLVTLAIFAVMQIVFIPTLGGSIGHRILGMRVMTIGGGWVGFWRPVVRTLLLCLVLPVLVWDSDQRGFHDKVPGTVLVRV